MVHKIQTEMNTLETVDLIETIINRGDIAKIVLNGFSIDVIPGHKIRTLNNNYLEVYEVNDADNEIILARIQLKNIIGVISG